MRTGAPPSRRPALLAKPLGERLNDAKIARLKRLVSLCIQEGPQGSRRGCSRRALRRRSEIELSDASSLNAARRSGLHHARRELRAVLLSSVQSQASPGGLRNLLVSCLQSCPNLQRRICHPEALPCLVARLPHELRSPHLCVQRRQPGRRRPALS